MLEIPEKFPHDIVENVVDICKTENLDILLYKCNLFAFTKNAQGGEGGTKSSNSPS